MMKKSWITGRIRSFKYAFQGVFYLFSTEPNARIHLLAALLVVALGAFFRVSKVEWIAIVTCIFVVFAAEAFNTAVESLTNLVSPQRHPLAGRVKDLAAGGVLLAALGAAVVGTLIFLPEIFDILWRLLQ